MLRSFFVDVLADYIAGAKFTRHELTEYVLPAVLAESAAVSHSNSTRALELAHAFAFRSGLGHSLYADEHSAGSISAEDVKAFHAQSLSSLAVLGTGISSDALTSLFEKGFKKAGISPSTADASASKSSYYGGSTRVTAGHGPQTVFIGFGTSGTASLPALYALNAHISPAPSVKWTTGTSTLSASIPAGVHASTVILPYSDATLFGVLLEGYDAKAVSAASKAAVDAFKSTASKVSAEDATKAVAKAKFTIAGGVEKREGFVSLLGPKVLSGEQAGLDSTVKAVEAVDAAAISKVRVHCSRLGLTLLTPLHQTSLPVTCSRALLPLLLSGISTLSPTRTSLGCDHRLHGWIRSKYHHLCREYNDCLDLNNPRDFVPVRGS